MSLKIAITVILAMLVFMPVTHYKAYKHGRITMNQEAIKAVAKGSFVLNGKIGFIDIIRQQGTCTNCHERMPR